MTTLIDRDHLKKLSVRFPIARGAETFESVLFNKPDELVEVSEPSLEPLDVRTYRLRLEHLNRLGGNVTHGLTNFVDELGRLREPTRALMIIGESTTYLLLLSADLDRVVASAAIDRIVDDSGV